MTRLSLFALAIVAGSSLLSLFPMGRLEAETPSAGEGTKWEFRAVSFGTSENENSKKLNDLAGAGWEYVGPLANSMVVFKRRVIPSPISPHAPADVETVYKDVSLVTVFIEPPFSFGGDPKAPPRQASTSALVEVKVKDRTVRLIADLSAGGWFDGSSVPGDIRTTLPSLVDGKTRVDIYARKTSRGEVITSLVIRRR